MAKTVPQLKKIERGDHEKVEQISAPHEWQRASALTKPAAAPNKPAAAPSDRTVPVGRPSHKRSR